MVKDPETLALTPEQAKKTVTEIGKEKKKNSLVQAVANLRQKNRPATVTQLNNLVACQQAVPDVPLTWSVADVSPDALHAGLTQLGGCLIRV